MSEAAEGVTTEMAERILDADFKNIVKKMLEVCGWMLYIGEIDASCVMFCRWYENIYIVRILYPQMDCLWLLADNSIHLSLYLPFSFAACFGLPFSYLLEQSVCKKSVYLNMQCLTSLFL